METIYEVLKREHDVVHALLRELHDTDVSEAQRRTAVLAEVVEHITAHSRAEQEVVYSRLTGVADDSLTQAVKDHGEIELALRDLVACDVHDELWMAKLEVVRAAVETHVDREETEVFAALRRHIDDESAERLAGEFVQRKAVLGGRAA